MDGDVNAVTRKGHNTWIRHLIWEHNVSLLSMSWEFHHFQAVVVWILYFHVSGIYVGTKRRLS